MLKRLRSAKSARQKANLLFAAADAAAAAALARLQTLRAPRGD